MQRYYFLLENMYRAMMIFWLTCLVGYPRTSAPEPEMAAESPYKQQALKGQNLLAQDNALGFNDIQGNAL